MNAIVPRARDSYQDTEVVHELGRHEEYILNHRGVNHPFLLWFSRNTDRAHNQHIFKEFYCFIRFLPFYIAGMSLNTRDERILREIVVNVAEEVGGRDLMPHLDIYRKFLDSIGVSVESLEKYECHENTKRIDEGIKKLYTQSDIMKSMGAMYALETMSSKMVSSLNDGLSAQEFDAEVRLFFAMHIAAEIGHSNGVYNTVGNYLKDPAKALLFNDGVEEFMGLIEGFWEGVSQPYGMYAES
jgi:pyrroloquinoline-quinone synthase